MGRLKALLIIATVLGVANCAPTERHVVIDNTKADYSHCSMQNYCVEGAACSCNFTQYLGGECDISCGLSFEGTPIDVRLLAANGWTDQSGSDSWTVSFSADGSVTWNHLYNGNPGESCTFKITSDQFDGVDPHDNTASGTYRLTLQATSGGCPDTTWLYWFPVGNGSPTISFDGAQSWQRFQQSL